MQAGPLRHRVVIQNLVETQNEMGELAQTWTDLATVWASFEPVTSRNFQELFVYEQFQGEINTIVTVRYIPGVSVKGRVLETTTAYGIVAVFNTGENDRELKLLCSKVLT